MNTQKAVTTLAQNIHEELTIIDRCLEPNQQVQKRKLYDALKYKYALFVKRKSVGHKLELENCQFTDRPVFNSGKLQVGLEEQENKQRQPPFFLTKEK